jgi:hypothetical protein
LLEATQKAKEIANSEYDKDYMELNHRVMQAMKNAIKMKMDISCIPHGRYFYIIKITSEWGI